MKQGCEPIEGCLGCRNEFESRDSYPCNYCSRNAEIFADNYVSEMKNAPEWDGHTPAEAIRRIGTLAEAEKNEPLTLDELREMVDEPAYLQIFNPLLNDRCGWHIIKAVTEDKIIYRGWQLVYTTIDGLGLDYNLYRHKPKEG